MCLEGILVHKPHLGAHVSNVDLQNSVLELPEPQGHNLSSPGISASAWAQITVPALMQELSPTSFVSLRGLQNSLRCAWGTWGLLSSRLISWQCGTQRASGG